MECIVCEKENFYKIVHIKQFRTTPGVSFDLLPESCLQGISSIDRVIHKSEAVSPGKVDGIDRPWYMHPYQDDKLIVLHGSRNVDIYLKFIVTPDKIIKDGQTIVERILESAG